MICCFDLEETFNGIIWSTSDNDESISSHTIAVNRKLIVIETFLYSMRTILKCMHIINIINVGHSYEKI